MEQKIDVEIYSQSRACERQAIQFFSFCSNQMIFCFLSFIKLKSSNATIFYHLSIYHLKVIIYHLAFSKLIFPIFCVVFPAAFLLFFFVLLVLGTGECSLVHEFICQTLIQQNNQQPINLKPITSRSSLFCSRFFDMVFLVSLFFPQNINLNEN
jgi:hypothetical protein